MKWSTFLAVLLAVGLSTAEGAAEPHAAGSESVIVHGETVSSPPVSEAATGNVLPLDPDEIKDGDAAREPAPVAETKPAAPLPPTLGIDINLTSQRMTVTENGVARHSWPVSSGAYGYPTPTGTFKPVWMSKMWYSRQYDMAPMPHSIFFHGGVAIHATYSVSLLGRPASHGCVRLSPNNAAALYKLVTRHGKDRTRIVVHGKPNYAAPKVARSNQTNPGRTAHRPQVRTSYSAYGYTPYAAGAPRYVYPGDQRYYFVPAGQHRAQQMKKRRVPAPAYSYSGYRY